MTAVTMLTIQLLNLGINYILKYIKKKTVILNSKIFKTFTVFAVLCIK